MLTKCLLLRRLPLKNILTEVNADKNRRKSRHLYEGGKVLLNRRVFGFLLVAVIAGGNAAIRHYIYIYACT